MDPDSRSYFIRHMFAMCRIQINLKHKTHLLGSAPLKYALTDSVNATAMGSESWDAKVTGLGPRDVPRSKECKEAQRGKKENHNREKS